MTSMETKVSKQELLPKNHEGCRFGDAIHQIVISRFVTGLLYIVW